jgi:hypothetical protein
MCDISIHYGRRRKLNVKSDVALYLNDAHILVKSKEHPPIVSLSDIFQSLMKEYHLTESDLPLIQSKSHFETVKKGGTFVKEGTRTNKIGILLDGILYARQTKSNGEEVVSRFFYSPRKILSM